METVGVNLVKHLGGREPAVIVFLLVDVAELLLEVEKVTAEPQALLFDLGNAFDQVEV